VTSPHPVPTTIHAAVCRSCGAIANADTRAETTGKTICPMCPPGESALQVHRYQLTPKVARNGRKPKRNR
jgi:hypothetical protein